MLTLLIRRFWAFYTLSETCGRFVCQELVFRYQQKTDACRSASDVFEATIGDLERPPSSAESQTMSGQTTNEQEDEEEDSSGNVKSLFCTKPFAIFKVN